MEELPDFKTTTFEHQITTIVNKLRDNNIIVVAICSDNASNNQALFAPDNDNNILKLGLIRIPCVAHLINLAGGDVKKDQGFELFYKMLGRNNCFKA